MIFNFAGSISDIASPIGTISIGLIIDRYGRKKALIFGIIPSILGWMLLYSDYNIVVVLFGKMLHGITLSAVAYPSQVYAGECIMLNHIRLRNSFIMWNAVSLSIGTTVMYLMSTFLNYHQIGAVGSVVSLIFLPVFYFLIPESPMWLYRKGRIGDAEWAQKKLGICQPLLQQCQHDNISPVIPIIAPIQFSDLKHGLEKLKRKDVYKPLFITIGISVLVPSSGPITVVTYMINIINNIIPGIQSENTATIPPIFNENYSSVVLNTTLANEDFSSSYKYGVGSGIIMVISTVTSCFVLPYVGLKNMWIFTEIGLCVGMSLLAYSVFADFSGNLFPLHVVSVWVITFFFSLIMNSPNTVAGDLFPSDAKGFASIQAIIANSFLFLNIKLYPYFYLAIGPYIYCIYSVICIICSIYMYFFVPEVVGKTLEEINQEFLIETE